LLQKHKLGIDKVVQHNKWSGKNCPRHLRAHDRGMNWEQFISLCKVDKQGWIQENGAWYFYEAGKMLSGCWKKDENKWYFLNNDGKMASKQWVEDKVDWYYLTGDGSMAASKWVKYSDGWYYLAADGKMVKGWQYLEWNGKKNWYYFHVEDTTDRKAGQMAYNEMIPVHVGSDGIAKG
jgi:glucan-binding YG repeat protein